MPVVYDPKAVGALEAVYADQKVDRPYHRTRYEPGTTLTYDVRGVDPDARARVELEVERFVGGGYAGQVYKVKIHDVTDIEGRVRGLEPGRSYALKIFVPPTGFGRRIRNILYALGFQGPFSLQVTEAAGRSQALWQKFLRRAARVELGTEDAVVDIFATLTDHGLGSYGELSEWIDGRMWRFEVDDNLDARHRASGGEAKAGAGSPEYRSKRSFMARLVRLMHALGATELARQYEWWSLKSQPNALKRLSSDPDPEAGLVAVDFRAGMALLPFAPQCPADFKLILRSLGRGRLVQYDKGDLSKLEAYVAGRSEEFADLRGALDELKREERAYRASLIDVTYHHVRLFGRKLRRSVMTAFRQSWRIRNITDERTAGRLEKSGFLSVIFLFLPWLAWATPALYLFAWPGRTWWKYLAWLLPLVLVPQARKLWGRADLRRHYGKMFSSPRYFLRASRARIAEALIRWHRAGRISAERALKIARHPWRYYLHVPCSILPAGFHRFLTDKAYLKQRLVLIFVRPVRLYFKPEAREKWLLDMIAQGEKNHMLSPAEAAHIASQIKEPFIQKYLKSLAVHVCTLPITQIVSVALAFIYVRTHPELTVQQASLAAGAIIALFQVIPISPGSLARGLYTTFLVLKERNFKDYNVAFGLSYFKYIGYLAFPIQMAYRYPDLARFMAGHWATGAVHIVPVFGEKGAWLEHFVFDVFYNYPLTVRRRMKARAETRSSLRPRAAHMPALVLAGTALLAALDFAYFKIKGLPPALKNIWWLALWIPFFASAVTSRLAGGMKLGRRIMLGTAAGSALGLLYAVVNKLGPAVYPGAMANGPASGSLIAAILWNIFLFTLVAVIGAFIAETRKPKVV
jgi:hypothetical protein